ncbi:MAG: hypothetical protein JSU57_03195 [Candidatus Heimdallarchaeota archaeon]|nr:MAG: hypothetical protein JSU57_03195 [Candidatus Heimdallarchaeota archaeon]
MKRDLESEIDLSGTEKWIEIVLKDLGEATTAEIIERVSIFNQECADHIPMVLTQMRIDSKISYEVVPAEGGERRNIVWRLVETQPIDKDK